MTDVPENETADSVEVLPDEDWLTRIEDLANELGFFEPLGPDHSALFFKRSRQLLVTFETIASARGQAKDDLPFSWKLAESRGWSQLCVLSHSETWFRHRALYLFFDRLTDSGFFDDYDRVVFFGAGSCGYGASAFSVAAPGATVIAVQPQATLDPRVAEWDARFLPMRRISFTGRYGYAPDMLDAAAEVYLLYDPNLREDAMHAALFTRPHVTKLRCRYLNGDIEPFLRQKQLLGPLLTMAMQDTLSPFEFHRLFRERRTYPPFLKRLLSATEDRGRPFLTGLACRSAPDLGEASLFRETLERAEHVLSVQGRSLPPQRSARSG